MSVAASLESEAGRRGSRAVRQLHLNTGNSRSSASHGEDHPYLERAAGLRLGEESPKSLGEVRQYCSRLDRLAGRIEEGEYHRAGRVSVIETDQLNVQIPGSARGCGGIERKQRGRNRQRRCRIAIG